MCVISFRFQRFTLADENGAIGCVTYEERALTLDSCIGLSNFYVSEDIVRLTKTSKISR